jgi:pimeloyl-ACP methyl ester carboxylesterase
MTPVASRVLLESGVSLSVAARGDPSGPALVLLPGPTDSWRSYDPVLERMPASIHAIAVSQRGHGDSDKLPTGYRVQDFAADVPLLLDAFGVAHAVLAGHSGSCLVARRVGLDHPERVAGLVLEASPTTLRGHAGFIEFVKSVVAKLEDPIDRAFARSFLGDTSSDHVEAELVDQLVDELMKVPVHAWKEMFASLLEYDDLVEIERITAPTLLVWGDADELVDRDTQTLLAEQIGGAELLVYQGVGHTPRWEDPTRFASDVAAFVERRARPPRP